jgi:regulator of protease activity HflC (stomatin/prohibitin superfamily)
MGCLCCCCYTVPQSEVKILERWGKFDSIKYPGLHVRNPISTNIAGALSLRVRELHIRVETKTKDNVFVTLVVTIQYRVLDSEIYKAFYELSMPEHQLQSYVFNNVRAQIPKHDLDALFIAKDHIAKTLKDELEAEMNEFGYTIVQTLITDIVPDAMVKRAMNDINAAQRLRAAATDKAEAEKISVVKAAEADAESKRLSGVGLAEQRKAIIIGLHESIKMFANETDIGQTEVMELLQMNQYFDTLKEMTGHNHATTIFVPLSNDASSTNSMGGNSSVRDGVLQAMYGKSKDA